MERDLTVCANNSVLYNRIYGVMNYLSDGGGIYTLSTQPGSNFSYNVIYDCGWNGLYPDERTNSTTWTYNVIWDTRNSIQDHNRFFENTSDPHPYSWNNISKNYLELQPTFAVPPNWWNLEGVNQIYNQRPGTSDFPQWIYNMSGVEPAYAGLVPTNEWHWQYISPSEIVNPIGSNWILPWILLIGTLVLIGIGLFLIVRTHGKDLVDRKPEEIISDDVGGDK